MYKYCPVCALTMEHRLPLLRKEIQGYHGDLVCLQEVDRFVFDDHLSKLDVVYGSEYSSRPNRTMGLAVLYNKNKFKLVSLETKVLRNVLATDDFSVPLLRLASNNRMLMNRLLRHDATVLFLVLQSIDDPSHYIIVANTHLYAPVNSDHARIVQAAIVINLLQRKLLQLKESLNQDAVISYVLCGDFNGTPRTGMLEYILSGKVSANHQDWYSAGLNEFHGTNISLSHDLTFHVASGFPSYTYYAEGYVDCIDYIFISPATVEVNKVLEAPPHELVTKYTALPSIIAPSDHIAQVVDLSLIRHGSNKNVSHSEKVYLFEARQRFTKNHVVGADRFRFVSYNILADCYALLKYFPYCPVSALDIKYRLPLLHKEIQGYHGDIVCLQEVDEYVFKDHLQPEMNKRRYGSQFVQKPGKKDGSAIFYHQGKFKLVSSRKVVLRESLNEDNANKSLLKFTSHNPAFKNRVMLYETSALLSVLQSVEDPTRYFVVVTTHLYYHSSAKHVRLIQIAVILNLIQDTIKNLQLTLSKGSTVSYAICGDLNSTPSTGLVEFILSGKLHSNHSDWYSGGPNEYHSTSQSLQHDLKLISACGFPKYTSYVAHVNHCLDYIFVGLHINVDKVLEAPPHELVTKYTALPSIIAPSDHIAQVVDLMWTSGKNA